MGVGARRCGLVAARWLAAVALYIAIPAGAAHAVCEVCSVANCTKPSGTIVGGCNLCASVPPGTVCAGSGTCAATCASNGGCTAVPSQTVCATGGGVNGPCNVNYCYTNTIGPGAGTCNTGAALTPISGPSCNDNQACTNNDTCQAGICKGTPYTCPTTGYSSDCISATFSTSACDGSGCSNAAAFDSTATSCSVGAPACTSGDHCDGAGHCSGSPVNCNNGASGYAIGCYTVGCSAASCSATSCPANACTYTKEAANTACGSESGANAANKCVTQWQCGAAGQCDQQGTVVQCPASPAPTTVTNHSVTYTTNAACYVSGTGACRQSDGTCPVSSYTPVAITSTTPCDDSDPCTYGDGCDTTGQYPGQCKGAPGTTAATCAQLCPTVTGTLSGSPGTDAAGVCDGVGKCKVATDIDMAKLACSGLTSGTACDVCNPCITGSTCDNTGTCSGGTPARDGTACSTPACLPALGCSCSSGVCAPPGGIVDMSISGDLSSVDLSGNLLGIDLSSGGTTGTTTGSTGSTTGTTSSTTAGGTTGTTGKKGSSKSGGCAVDGRPDASSPAGALLLLTAALAAALRRRLFTA